MEEIMEEILDSYYGNGAKKLQRLVNFIVNKKFGGITGKDMDAFYSTANEVMADIYKKKRYDPSKGDFEGFLYKSLVNAFINDYRYDNRNKRMAKIEIEIDTGGKIEKKKVPVPDIYLDAPVGDKENFTIGDTLQSGFDMDSVLGINEEYSENIKIYLESLSEMPKRVAELIMDGNGQDEITSMLNITKKQYKSCMDTIKSYDKKRILYKENNNDVEEEKMDNIAEEQDVIENYKNTSYSIESISKQLKKKRIRDDHILQRHSGQWKNYAKSLLIADILRGKSLTQIIICEEIKDGLRMQWLIDGKQRCTTLDSYLHDGFSISKNIKNYYIKYQAPRIDKTGNEILNEDGFSIMEWKAFDIRGKKFSQLPEELQDIFKDRQIPVLYETNCSKKDIAEDIARFNRSRAMNKAQNGWLELEEDFAELVENIAKMPFFQPEFAGSNYTKTNYTSGTIRRIIVESIMVSDFIDDFGDFNQMCEFLSEEASDSNFTEFYSLVERLTEICKTDKNAYLFNAKDSFLWFGLFSKFSTLNLNDKKFGDFMDQFDSMRKLKIGGVSFDDILNESKSTKGKSIIKKKMKHLELLMNKYLGISEKEDDEIGTLDFIKENINTDITQEDVEQYKEVLDVLTLNVDNSSKLMDEENKVSLTAMVAFSFENDIDLDDWIIDFFNRNTTYIKNQKENYIHMKDDLVRFINKN